MGALAMQCPNCGFERGTSFSLCSGCGSKVPSGVAVVRPRDAACTARLKWGVLAATIVVPLVGIVMGGIFVVDARTEQRALGRLWLIAGVVVTLADLAAWVLY
jgi:hypothetical protein